MALKDFPELHALFEKLQAEKAELVARAKPYRDKYDEIMKQIAPFQDEARAQATEFKKIEQPRMAEIDNQLGAIARASGGRAMSDVDQAPAA